ncbi:MAG: hypothetical protein RKE49_01635 [Oceanicaulis sp.]
MTDVLSIVAGAAGVRPEEFGGERLLPEHSPGVSRRLIHRDVDRGWLAALDRQPKDFFFIGIYRDTTLPDNAWVVGATCVAGPPRFFGEIAEALAYLDLLLLADGRPPLDTLDLPLHLSSLVRRAGAGRPANAHLRAQAGGDTAPRVRLGRGFYAPEVVGADAGPGVLVWLGEESASFTLDGPDACAGGLAMSIQLAAGEDAELTLAQAGTVLHRSYLWAGGDTVFNRRTRQTRVFKQVFAPGGVIQANQPVSLELRAAPISEASGARRTLLALIRFENAFVDYVF